MLKCIERFFGLLPLLRQLPLTPPHTPHIFGCVFVGIVRTLPDLAGDTAEKAAAFARPRLATRVLQVLHASHVRVVDEVLRRRLGHSDVTSNYGNYDGCVLPTAITIALRFRYGHYE